jgi:phosphatidylserine/phosphatidylglycerophosphate/cardiolipin synthase-like enzyme
MSEPKCEPQYWFLNSDRTESHDFKERGTGNPISILDGQLLEGRYGWWLRLARKNWKLRKDQQEVLAADYTSDNLVTPLVDGKAYMGDLYSELQRSGEATVLLAGWQFTSTLSLVGPPQASKQTELLEVLKNALKNQWGIRILGWDNPKLVTLNFPTNWAFAQAVNKSVPLPPSGYTRAWADSNLDGSFLSHHQKEVVIYRRTGECCAYVGGIDLGVDRWDDENHQKTRTSGNFIAWHDVQVKVRGDAFLQLWANFAERWENSIAWLEKEREKGKSEYRLEPCPPPEHWEWEKPGSHHVQVLRTVTPSRSSFRARSMPDGEYTVLCALKKAISLAECYIYIEEQFLWDCELADFIAKRMQSAPNLRLIVVLAAATELPLKWGDWHFHQRSKFFMTVMNVDSKEEIVFGKQTRVYPYGLYRKDRTEQRVVVSPHIGRAKTYSVTIPEPVYVHSKVVIIDDRYVAVGSANFAARSMWVDTELTLGVVDDDQVDGQLDGKDTKVCRFARDLRRQLWREHLRSPAGMGDNADPVVDLGRFPGAGGVWPKTEAESRKRKIGRAQCYVNVPGADWFVGQGWPNLLDPTERHFRLTSRA